MVAMTEIKPYYTETKELQRIACKQRKKFPRTFNG